MLSVMRIEGAPAGTAMNSKVAELLFRGIDPEAIRL
jgi:hypothetical protein